MQIRKSSERVFRTVRCNLISHREFYLSNWESDVKENLETWKPGNLEKAKQKKKKKNPLKSKINKKLTFLAVLK